MRPQTLVPLLTVLLLAPGCDKLKEAVDAGGSSPAADQANPQGQGAAPALDADEQRSAKLQPYIKCLNGFSESIHKSRIRYMEETDPKEGPNDKTRLHANNLKMFGDPAECIEAMRAGVDIDPDEPELEKAGVAFADALEKLQGPMKEAFDYYDKEDFKDDKWAKGKELHAKLMAGFDAFAPANEALHAQVDTLNSAVQQAQLAKLEKEKGRTLPFLIANTNMQAKQLIKASDVPKFEDLELEPQQKALAAYSEALTELRTYVEAHPKEAKEITMFSMYTSAANDFEKAAKALMRRKRDNEPYSRGELMLLNNNSTSVEGSPGQVIDKYNTLIERGNRL